MAYTSLNNAYQSALVNLINYAHANISTSLSNDLYLAKALEAYIWGYSFEWLYAKEQQQAYGVAGSRDVSTPLNSFYINTQPTAKSTGDVAPDVAVLYANAFLNVSSGSPVVVQYPNSSAGNQFVMMQISNSATQNIASPSSFVNANGNAGGNILFYEVGDPNLANYTGNFIEKIALNTKLALATGRVLVDPCLTSPASSPFSMGQGSETNSLAVAKQFVAASYEAYAGNGYSMAGLSNGFSTVDTPASTAAYNLYSAEPNNINFWKFLGDALVQSPLPTTGIGSESNFLNLSPTQYLATLKDLGLSASGWDPSQLSAIQLADLTAVAKIGYQLLQDTLSLASTLGSGSWANVPSNLGSFPNNIIGYLERDIAHVANSPATAIYPTVYKDSNGDGLLGSQTYTITLKNVNGAQNPPPLAQPSQGASAVANSTGFWAFNAYDANSNITPAITGYTNYVNSALGFTPVVTNSVTGSVNYSVSSVLLPSSNVVPISNQLKVEANGDLIFILSPEAPKDASYVNNWIPTPLVTYNNASGSFITGDAFSMMLRVYTPNISTTLVNGQAVLVDGSGKEWVIPKVTLNKGLANVDKLVGGSIGTNAIFYDSARADQFTGSSGVDINTFTQSLSQYQISKTSNGSLLVTNTSTKVADTLTNIERLKFTDTNVAFDTAPTQNAGSVYMLYKAAFNRTPDASGMGYWLAKKDGGSNIVSAIGQSFVNSTEFTTKYGSNLSNAAFVDKLYQNVLGRAGDSGGVAYWNQELDAGRMSKAAVLVQFASVAEGAANVASLIANGIGYTEYVG